MEDKCTYLGYLISRKKQDSDSPMTWKLFAIIKQQLGNMMHYMSVINVSKDAL